MIDSSACDKQAGRVLLQEQPIGRGRPIVYWSWLLNTTECTYDTTHQQSLAVIWALLLLRLYLERCRFPVRIDNDALNSMLNLTDFTCKPARWRLCLSELESYIVQGAVIKHEAAEAFLILKVTDMIIRRSMTNFPYCKSRTPSSPKHKRLMLAICTKTTQLSTKMVSDYLQYRPLWHRQNANTMNARSLHKTSYTSRRNTCIVHERHLQ